MTYYWLLLCFKDFRCNWNTIRDRLSRRWFGGPCGA